MIARIAVVIPARNEEETIAECLDSVRASARLADVRVAVVVVADSCRDRTVELARERGADVLRVEVGNVGLARGAGSRRALAAGADWLAHTDADSTVPRNWIAAQCAAAAEDWDVVVGTVRPRFAELTREQRRAWIATHAHGEALGHVHGANLGIRASAYLAAGGFRPLAEHEDVDLVDRLRLIGSVTASDSIEVITSGRRWGRTAGGYAGYLREQLIPLATESAAVMGGTDV
jgi:glycosyltransferase involved in cell wall biosynthesis